MHETALSARSDQSGRGDGLRGSMGRRMGLRRSRCDGREEETAVSGRSDQSGRGTVCATAWDGGWAGSEVVAVCGRMRRRRAEWEG